MPDYSRGSLSFWEDVPYFVAWRKRKGYVSRNYTMDQREEIYLEFKRETTAELPQEKP